MSNEPFRVSAGYIEWAHGPGAESGYPMATELCNMPDNKRGQIEVPADRLDLVREIISVAELYVGGRRGDTDLQAARVISRARKYLTEASL